MVVGERRLPERPPPGMVMVEAVAAGVNRPDILQKKGLYPPPKSVTEVLGLEVSGTVKALGEGVGGLRVGDEVCALLSGGGYSRHCLAHQQLCLPIPNGVSLGDAAALPEAFFTAWSSLVWLGGLREGQTALVHGGAGGVGSAAVQLAAKVVGAKVITTAGSDEKCQFCRSIGAALTINYRREDFLEKTLEFTQKRGVNVVLDMVGGDYVGKNLKALDKEGKLINIAFQNGARVELNLLPVMLRRLTITGATLRIRSLAFKAKLADELKRLVWHRFNELEPCVGNKLPISQAERAHELMEKGEHRGKIVLLADDENW